MATKPSATLSEQLSQARLMAEGLKKRSDVVSKVGLTEERADEIANLAKALASLDNEQEELKSALKLKTAALDEKQKELSAVMAEAKKLVKIAVDQNDWLTFGINDKK